MIEITYLVVLLSFLSYISAQVICPDLTTYSPCECTEYTGAQTFVFPTSKLDCSNRNLNDSKVNDILNAFTFNPLVSPVNQLILYGNQLTLVPQQIPQFQWLTFVNINNNQIPSIELAAFNFYTEKLNLIDLSDNQITNIKPNAFQGVYINYSKIFLDKNNMTRFDSDVFQSVLEQMAPHPEFPGSYISIGDNPIDCTSDYCHLAWLIRDNPSYLNNVKYSGCSNGTRFEDLNPYGYSDCS